MATQKGLRPDNIFALTDETRTEFWIHVAIPGYEQMTAHYTVTNIENLNAEIDEAFVSFIEQKKNEKFEIEFDFESEINDPNSDIARLLDELRNDQYAPTPKDSWESIVDDAKTNVTQKVNDMKDSLGDTTDKAKDILKEKLKRFRKN